MPKKFKIRGIIGLDESATPEALEAFLDDSAGEDVDVEFNSPGGFVYFGLEMANMIRDYDGKTTARLVGLAASMASYIPTAFDKVLVAQDAVYMIHNPMAIGLGDYRDFQKLTNRLESLAALLGSAYVDQSGKPEAEVRELMDEETFYYGKEIVDAGFADGMIKVKGQKKSKSAAVAVAHESISTCIAKMKESEISVSDDYERAAALLDDFIATEESIESVDNGGNNKPPAAAGKPKEEASTMNFAELLAANPDAKAEYDAAILAAADTARTEGEATGKTAGKAEGMEQMKTAFTAALPILTSASYPEAVKERVTAKAVDGDIEGLKDFVAMHDMNVEKAKEGKTAEEIAAETLAQADHNKDLTSDGMVNTTADVDTAAAQLKSEYGIGGNK